MICTNSLEGLLFSYCSSDDDKKVIFFDNCHYYDNEFVEYDQLLHKNFVHLFTEQQPFLNKRKAVLASKEELTSYLFFILSLKGNIERRLFKYDSFGSLSQESMWIGISPHSCENFIKLIHRMKISDPSYGVWKCDAYCASHSQSGSFLEGNLIENYKIKYKFSSLSNIDDEKIEVFDRLYQVKQRKTCSNVHDRIISNDKAISLLKKKQQICTPKIK